MIKVCEKKRIDEKLFEINFDSIFSKTTHAALKKSKIQDMIKDMKKDTERAFRKVRDL